MTAEPRAGRRADEWPPALAIVAGVCAFIGIVPGVLFVLSVPLTVGYSLAVVSSDLRAGLVCIVMPWLLGFGALRLLSRTSRWPLVLGGLPVTAVVVWLLYDAAYGDGEPWLALVLLGPAVAPFLALAPSVEAWLRAEDAEPASPGL